jgi:hypothetical protein
MIGQEQQADHRPEIPYHQLDSAHRCRRMDLKNTAYLVLDLAQGVQLSSPGPVQQALRLQEFSGTNDEAEFVVGICRIAYPRCLFTIINPAASQRTIRLNEALHRRGFDNRDPRLALARRCNWKPRKRRVGRFGPALSVHGLRPHCSRNRVIEGPAIQVQLEVKLDALRQAPFVANDAPNFVKFWHAIPEETLWAR